MRSDCRNRWSIHLSFASFHARLVLRAIHPLLLHHVHVHGLVWWTFSCIRLERRNSSILRVSDALRHRHLFHHVATGARLLAFVCARERARDASKRVSSATVPRRTARIRRREARIRREAWIRRRTSEWRTSRRSAATRWKAGRNILARAKPRLGRQVRTDGRDRRRTDACGTNWNGSYMVLATLGGCNRHVEEKTWLWKHQRTRGG